MRIPTRAEVDAFCGSPTTLYQRVAGVAAPVLLLGTIVYLLLRLPHLPAQIPSHYNAAGEIDGYSGRGSLLVMPVIGLVTVAVIAVTARFPKSWNTGVRLTAINRVRVYRLTRDLMAELRLAMALIFAGFGVYLSFLPQHFSGVVTALMILLPAIPIVRYFLRLRR
jgi:uncharacterized membrane protein